MLLRDVVFMGDVHCVLQNKPLCNTQSSFIEGVVAKW